MTCDTFRATKEIVDSFVNKRGDGFTEEELIKEVNEKVFTEEKNWAINFFLDEIKRSKLAPSQKQKTVTIF